MDELESLAFTGKSQASGASTYSQEPEHKNQIATPDKPALELNLKESMKLELEYKNKIAHPDPPKQELNLKEHSELES
jgi:hypothetical protein